jgi:dipeptidyl aminopeptidase/acylaminoacyl peptidase
MTARDPRDPGSYWGVPLPPELVVPASLAEWEPRRAAIRSRLREALGAIPPRPLVPSVRVISRENRDGYVLEQFSFDNGAGAEVPGYCLIPAGETKKHPAVLYCHYHGDDYPLGKAELFQDCAAGEPPGPALVRRGYLVFCVDAYCFGERSGRGPGGPTERGATEEMSASKLELWAGRSLWAMMLRDDLMALDCLLSREDVQIDRVAVTGMSMGATRSWWLMALDDRICAGAITGCLTLGRALVESGGLRFHGIYYYLPGLFRHFDTDAICSLLAPRPVLLQHGDRDPGSPVEGVRHIAGKMREVYALLGAGNELESVVYPGAGHVQTAEMWARTFEWLEFNLRPV